MFAKTTLSLMTLLSLHCKGSLLLPGPLIDENLKFMAEMCGPCICNWVKFYLAGNVLTMELEPELSLDQLYLLSMILYAGL